jgi:hypothetical protein
MTSLRTITIIILFSLISTQALANHNSSNIKQGSSRIFTSYETSGQDYIYGIGIGKTFKLKNSDFGYQLNTSLNWAEVTATDGFIEEYIAWQGAVKLGLFSTISVYAEFGIDLSEALFGDFRYDDDDYRYDYYTDDIDAFVGIGAGFKAGPIKIEAISRLREIDSRYWEAREEVFTGMQFSINF